MSRKPKAPRPEDFTPVQNLETFLLKNDWLVSTETVNGRDCLSFYVEKASDQDDEARFSQKVVAPVDASYMDNLGYYRAGTTDLGGHLFIIWRRKEIIDVEQ